MIPEYGSIGASGNLIPLSDIAATLVGTDTRVPVDFDGKTISASEALSKLNTESSRFAPKEALHCEKNRSYTEPSKKVP